MNLNGDDDDEMREKDALNFACRWPVWGSDPFGGQICYGHCVEKHLFKKSYMVFENKKIKCALCDDEHET